MITSKLSRFASKLNGYVLCFLLALILIYPNKGNDDISEYLSKHINGYSENEVLVTDVASANVIERTNEEKVEDILVKYNLTQYQFNVIVAVVMAEAGPDCYDDAYAVINTIYNRTISKNWAYSIKNGTNLYNQVIRSGQFSVYGSGIYKKYLNNTTYAAYQAVIDFLDSEIRIHDYLSFKANFVKINGEQLFENGNIYHNLMQEEDLISEDYTLVSKI